MHIPMLLTCILFAAIAVAAGNQPNPPNWPGSVSVFGPSDAAGDIQAKVKAAFAINGGQTPDDHGQFSDKRFAFLFKPGTYNVEVPVGYYTQVLGLGTHPSDVVFTSAKGVYCIEGSYSVSPGALDSFWRSAENFQTNADFTWTETNGMLWAASQASPLRRIVVTNNLKLYQYRQGDFAAGYASGGFLGNSQVKGHVGSGSQQQYLTRNVDIGSWQNGVWNMVFVGVPNAPPSHCGSLPSLCAAPFVVQPTTPTIAEKPFISISSAGKFFLNIPAPAKQTAGANFAPGKSVGFDQVYVASDSDSASTINAALAQGLHVVLSPGIYNLDSALELNNNDQVLLGLGLATLVSTNGNAVVKVGDVDGVRVAGILLEAGSKATDALLVWGNGTHIGDGNNPGALSDVFARVCGSVNSAQATVMVQINSGNVIGDNLWLWRADHTVGGLVRNRDCPCDHGMVVEGDDVTMYGLASEHQLKDLVVWDGDRGASYFFQAELPYDVTQAQYGDMGYVGYRVGSKVTSHISYGAGVYHYFRDYVVTVETGISVPTSLESSFVSPLAVYLNGKGTMNHVINNQGNQTKQGEPAPGGGPSGAVPVWLCPSDSKQGLKTEGSLDNFKRSFNFVFNTTAPTTHCNVGDPVTCPGTSIGCAGNACCPDGTTCPSADDRFKCCPKPKTEDCTKEYLPEGDVVVKKMIF